MLHGSSPDVGVLGYSLGGGMGWYARELGLQTNALTGATVVTADGSIVHASATENADLFWAIRGGGGNYGVVTEVEFRTFDFADAYAGMLVWPWEQAEAVLRRLGELGRRRTAFGDDVVSHPADSADARDSRAGSGAATWS